MKRFVIVTALLAVSACADFPAGTKVAPAFPNDNFELSHNSKAPGSTGTGDVGEARALSLSECLVPRVQRRE